MKKQIQTQIHIQAPVNIVWKILMDFQNYPEWNPFICHISGEPQVGRQLQLEICPPDSSAMKFSPKVLECIKNQSFIWKGKLLINGIFDGQHQFTLQEQAEGSTLLIHEEYFSGILVRWIDLSKTEKGFQLMNDTLKKRAEALLQKS